MPEHNARTLMPHGFSSLRITWLKYKTSAFVPLFGFGTKEQVEQASTMQLLYSYKEDKVL